MFPEPQLVSLLLMYLCSSCVCVHSRQNKEGRREKRKTLQAFLHLFLPFPSFLPLACFRSVSLSLTEVHHKNKAYEGRSSLIATGEPDCTLRWRNEMDGRTEDTGRQRHAKQTDSGREAHARTLTGMKFSDTSFAGWRHQVRRSCRTWEETRGREGRRAYLMIVERAAVASLS